MAHEVTIPLLPCSDIDEIADFYAMLGFERTYRQVRPNPYAALRREDLHLHFFGMPGFDPEQSYGTCLVQVPDVRVLWTAFADGMRAAHGKVLVAGLPRMTRPRPRRNDGGVTGFSLVDPGGNWIRVFEQRDAGTPPPADRLARAVENAIVQADSHGDHRQAAKILDGALTRAGADADPVTLVEALAYRAELAETLGDDPGAAALRDRLRGIELTPEQRERAAAALTDLD